MGNKVYRVMVQPVKAYMEGDKYVWNVEDGMGREIFRTQDLEAARKAHAEVVAGWEKNPEYQIVPASRGLDTVRYEEVYLDEGEVCEYGEYWYDYTMEIDASLPRRVILAMEHAQHNYHDHLDDCRNASWHLSQLL